MKKAVLMLTIILVACLLGLIGGNLWGDHARSSEPIGFDIGTRITYLQNGLIAGGASGLLFASTWLLGMRLRRRNRPVKHDSEQD